MSKEVRIENGRPALLALRSIGIVAVVWVAVGVPVAGVIAATRIGLWVIESIPAMAVTAAVLGAVQGLWLYLAGQPSESKYGGLLWLGLASGGILGGLGFPPVFSRTEAIFVDGSTVAVFLMAATVGGAVAGFFSGILAAPPQRDRNVTLTWKVVIFGLLVLPLTAIDYHFYWPATANTLPVGRVSREEVMNLPGGDAQGSAWAGCYEYNGQFSLGSGIVGGEGGLLRVEQTDGVLRIRDGEAHSFSGGVDRQGRFRFGAEIINNESVLRMLWQGRFHGESLEFKQRATALNGADIANTTLLTGTATRIPCYRWAEAPMQEVR